MHFFDDFDHGLLAIPYVLEEFVREQLTCCAARAYILDQTLCYKLLEFERPGVHRKFLKIDMHNTRPVYPLVVGVGHEES